MIPSAGRHEQPHTIAADPRSPTLQVQVTPSGKSMPGVLMVIGAYYPELSGGGLPCREIVTRLRDRARFTVLTTTANQTADGEDAQDGVPVIRVYVDPTDRRSKLRAIVRMAAAFWRARRRFSIVHLHGFSQKSILMVALARLLGKRLVVTLTSVGHDDPISMQRRGAMTYWAYSRADVFAAVSPRFRPLYESSSLPPARFKYIPNAVDTQRFAPVSDERRRALRRELGLPEDGSVVLFVGFFSREKGPDRAFETFARVSGAFPRAHLVLIGATRSAYYEVDVELADSIRRTMGERRLGERVTFVESTLEIHKYFQAADVYLLTSTREGLPVALLEAMSTGLGCIATRLEGITDVLLTDHVSGLLVEPLDVDGFEASLRVMLADDAARRVMGARARDVIERGFGVDRMVEAYLASYLELTA